MAEVKRSLRVQPTPFGYVNLSRIYQVLEKYDSAYLAAEKAGNFSRFAMGLTYFKSGEFQKGMEIINDIKNEPINSWNAFNLAHLYAEIDSLDNFFEYANYEPAHAFHPWLRVMIENPRVISDPRFKQLMDKMNLPMPVIEQEQQQEPASSG